MEARQFGNIRKYPQYTNIIIFILCWLDYLVPKFHFVLSIIVISLAGIVGYSES